MVPSWVRKVASWTKSHRMTAMTMRMMVMVAVRMTFDVTIAPL